eukprot:TRINITY_DN6136_c0_g2_i4.p1 TRINITY_DN6136_c0_g2~~TRINITY_DN6136_c0_g2_i4.p1  ORF type:complete len:102 (-),score=14.65 TRINITY_DN6136_c0_g2_i4:11-295(-)
MQVASRARGCPGRFSGGTSLHDHQRERVHVGLQRHQDAHQAGQCDGVEEHVAQDVAFVIEPACRGRGDDDGLRVEIGRAVQQECRDRSRMPSSA